MKKLFAYILPYRKAALCAMLLMLVEVMCDLMQPTLMSHIVDYGVANQDMGYIARTGLMMVGIALVGIAGGMGCVYFASTASQHVGADIRLDMFKNIQTFSFDKLDQFHTSSLITRLTNDVVQVQNVVLMMLRMLTRFPLLFIGGIGMAFALNAQMALIFLVTVPLLLGALILIFRKGIPLFKHVQTRLDKLNGIIRENLAGVRVIKAFVRSDYEKERFQEKNEDLAEMTVRAARVMALMMPVMMLVMNFSIVAVLWFGGMKVDGGSMQVGEVIAFTNYMMQILFALMMVGMMLMTLSRAKVSADRIAEVLNTKTDIADNIADNVADASYSSADSCADGEACNLEDRSSTHSASRGELSFDNVSFGYAGGGGQLVLQQISFTAQPGERIAILGSTGAGKSTLVNLIPRFYDVTEGRILLDGTDIRHIPLRYLRQQVGMVLQESILFSGTIRDNIRWGQADAAEEEVQAAAEAAQATEFIHKLPDGYDTIIGQRGVNLSGGQKQRLSIARALLKRPAILILDDSTSVVDTGTEARMQKAFREQLKGTTCFIVAQRISSVLDADRIIVLDDGCIVGIGTHGDLMENCDVYQDIYRSQVGEEAV
ncbi:ABC transporter ATP-binding protein/permease [Paenibacillus alvei]|uniref:ABC transporter ATP-binding protein n=1 Tax=Paenibacillus alvei TaxID=44250 RepID=UPI000287E443|nr:ABC transporter ATP-binding protein [Paenibacillus alvei]EJW19783.1 putative ABC-type multidrug transport protein [Paenibacillus alvei DSM 29]MCY9541273.1 ABC transporter ATP-binding protein/permease [Paenibacillus alvei]MCY9705058.1 ABC transporter ATP-binding protein/permease [Paenibacillus alvei]MCY9734734.1 ABC transporter ATP-binding protein/permease [Paenibacillus alvei]MCY9753943.1 ABC transporter ATP-binding protein/permease [Paenibacillus alvei]